MSIVKIEDELERIQFNSQFAEKHRNGAYRLSEAHVKILAKINAFRSRLRDLEPKINQAMEDNFMDIDEAGPLKRELEEILHDVNQFLDDHEYNKLHLNQLILISKNCEDLLVNVRYLDNIERTLGDTYRGSVKFGHYIDSTVKQSIFSRIAKVVEPADKGYQAMDEVEIDLLTLTKYLAHLERVAVDDVLYLRKSQSVKGLEQLMKKYKDSMYEVSRFYKSAIFSTEIKKALEGLDMIMEHKEMQESQRVKLKGLISSVSGYSELERLSKKIERLD